MMIAKTSTIFLATLLLQVGALPTNDDKSLLTKENNEELDLSSSLVQLSSFFSSDSDTYLEVIPSVANTLYKLSTCNPETKKQLLKIGDIMSCINITLNIYDSEVSLYHVLQFGLEVYDDVKNLGINILDCRNGNVTDIFDVVECALNVLDESFPVLDTYSEKVMQLISELKEDYAGIMKNLKSCKGLNTTTVVTAWRLVNEQC